MKPIFFNTEMVRALLEGRKTVTRRVVRQSAVDKFVLSQDNKLLGSFDNRHPEWEVYPTIDDSPYRPGDILYVRETFCKENGKYYYRADFDSDYLDPCETLSGGYPFACRYRDCNFCDAPVQRIIWHPSIHMPREAARLFLRVTDVRVERLQEMTDDDFVCDFGVCREAIQAVGRDALAIPFWDSTIKKPADRALYGWDANPWVWVIAFERCEKPEEKSPVGDAGNG